MEPKEYEIKILKDFLKIPPERIDDFLKDFKMILLNVHATAEYSRSIAQAASVIWEGAQELIESMGASDALKESDNLKESEKLKDELLGIMNKGIEELVDLKSLVWVDDGNYGGDKTNVDFDIESGILKISNVDGGTKE